MKTRIFLFAILLVIGFPLIATAQWGLTGNPVLPTYFLGSTNNQPLRIRTNLVERMRVNEALNMNAAYLTAPLFTFSAGYYPTYLPFQGNGYVGLNTTQPRTRLEIHGTQTSTPSFGTGWRPWMQTGVYMNEESNNMYVGMYSKSPDAPGDAVMNWGDDNGNPSNRLRIIFTPAAGNFPPAGAPVADRDREMMSFWNSRNIGMGDFINFTTGPQSHLHIHNAFAVSDYQQMTTTATGFTNADGLRYGIPDATNLGLQGMGILYNQETRPLLFSTNANTNAVNINSGNTLERMRITSISAPTNLVGGGVGVWNPGALANTNLTRVAISHDPTQPILRPMSLLHLGYNVSGNISPLNGWRPWMDVGMFVAQGTDNVYLGLKREPSTNPLNSGDRFDAVLNWGDNLQNPILQEGPDNLRFIFTGGVNDPFGTPQTQSANGVEVVRITPNNLVANPNVINKPSMGIGDFTGIPVNANNYVGATLDVDGDARIRSVNQNDNLNQVLVRDPADLGRVFWRDASTFGTANVQANDGCSIDPTTPGRVQWGNDLNTNTADLINDREINMQGFNTYFKGQTASINGVQSAIGLGYNITAPGAFLPAKLSVVENFGYIPYTPGATNPLYNTYVGTTAISGINTDAGSNNTNTSNINLIGVYGECSGVEGANTKVFHSGGRFFASNAQYNLGVEGIGDGSYASSNITTGGRFLGFSTTTNGNVFGSIGFATQGQTSTGVSGNASNSTLQNIGVSGTASGTLTSANYAGGYFISSGPTGSLQAGVYCSAPIDPGNSYALYVNGDAICTGTATGFASDSLMKTNVTSVTNAGSILSQLNPVTYNYNTSGFPMLNLDNGMHYGVIAQQIQNVLPSIVVPFNTLAEYDSLGNVVTPSQQLLSVRYNELIPILIAGYNEQQQVINQQQQQLQTQDSTIQAIQNTLNQLIAQVNNCCNSSMPIQQQQQYGNTTGQQQPIPVNERNVTLSDGDYIVLNQNVPNPFAESTTISYHIPERIGFAQIIFYNNLGQIIRIADIEERGYGRLNVYADNLSSGMYSYSLVVDGKVYDTKKMIKE